MYSRYSGVSIPQNYSGSRFSSLAEVETKTHKPTFQPIPIKTSAPVVEYENYEEIEEEILDEAAGDIELPLDENVQEESNTPLKTLLSSIEREELILLGLILLLISDSSQNNTEAIMMLILLLIGGK